MRLSQPELAAKAGVELPFVHGQLAGHLTQDEQGYTFAYAPAYLLISTAEPVSLTLPPRAAPYVEQGYLRVL